MSSECPVCSETFETERGMKIHKTTGHSEPYQDKEWLEEKYHGEGLNGYEIADECDVVCEVIYKYLEKFEIDTRSKSEAAKLWWEKSGESLREDYAEKMSEIGSSHSTTYWDTYSDEEKLEVRKKISEAKRAEKNPKWKGGEVEYYGSNWDWVRKRVLERDNDTCQVCQCQGSHVHHIIPIREFEDPEDGNYKENLITLCASCHPKVECGKIEVY